MSERMSLFKSGDEKWSERARKAADDGLSMWIVTLGDLNAMRITGSARSLDGQHEVVAVFRRT